MKITYFVALLLLASNYCLAQPGTLDPTFNTTDTGNGKGDGANAFVYTSEYQPDGKILFGGNFTYYGGIDINRIARIAANGYPDLTFNPGTGANDTVHAIKVLSSGQILVGGSFTDFNGTTINRLVRLNSNGTIDPSFNIGSGFNNSVYTISVQSDGKIIVSGNFTTVNGVSKNRIVRLNTNGTVDATFNVGTGTNAKILCSDIQSDGKIIIGGSFTTYNGTSQRGVSRLTTTGAIDATFVSGTGINTVGGRVEDLSVQADGKIVIVGIFGMYNGASASSMARINTDGSNDAGFGSLTSVPGIINSLEIQADGKYIIAGSFTSVNGFVRNRLARLTTNGSLDSYNVATTSGASSDVNTICLQSNGYVFLGGEFQYYSTFYDMCVSNVNTSGNRDALFNIPSAFDTRIGTMTVQSDNKILVGGSFTSYGASTAKQIVRLLPNGAIDGAFSSGSGVGPNSSIRCIELLTSGTIVIGGTFSAYNGTSRSNIAQINANGKIDATFNPGTGANNQILSIAIQPDGKIIAGGWFSLYNGTSCSGLVRINPDGSIDGSFNIPSLSSAAVYAVELQPDGKIIIGGNFTLVNGTTVNRIARLNSDGTLDGTFNTGSGANAAVTTICLLNNGKIAIGGDFVTVNGNPYAKIAMLNSNGNVNAGFSTPTTFNFSVSCITELPDQNLAVGGYFTLFNSTHIDYITCMDKFGNRVLSYDFGSGANQFLSCMALQNNKLLIGGAFTNYDGVGRNRIARLMLCNTTVQTSNVTSCDQYYWPVNGVTYNMSGLYSDTLTSIGGCDSIVKINLTIKHSTTSTTNLTVCNGLNWNGNYYSTSGIFTYTTTNSVGCDSTATLNLIVHQSSSSTQTVESCNSYTWINGVTYYASTNNPTWTLTNIHGCDSVVTLNLIIHNSNSGIDVQTACDSYTWIDNITYYSSTNVPTWTLSNMHGCDSVVTLNLTINNSNSGIDTQITCDSLTWVDGVTYYSSTNTPTWAYTNSAGCDSIVTLNLTINHSNTGIDTQIACDSLTWIDGITYTSSTNTPIWTLTNIEGCDSVVTLHLTVNNSVLSTDVQTACGSYTWIDGVTYSSSTNTPTWVLANINGCDSIVTLNLTINTIPSALATDNGDASITAGGLGTYQWINCNNNSEINGANSATFVPTINGTYAVVVGNGNCSDTSNCVVINNVGLNSLNAQSFQIFPNPTNHLVTILFSTVQAKLTIYDAQGKLINSSSINSGEQVSLKDLETGVYFFEIITTEGSTTQRVVKN